MKNYWLPGELTEALKCRSLDQFFYKKLKKQGRKIPGQGGKADCS